MAITASVDSLEKYFASSGQLFTQAQQWRQPSPMSAGSSSSMMPSGQRAAQMPQLVHASVVMGRTRRRAGFCRGGFLDGGLGQTASARQALAQLSAEALRCGYVRVVGAAGSHAGRQRVLADERARRHHVEPALA